MNLNMYHLMISLKSRKVKQVNNCVVQFLFSFLIQSNFITEETNVENAQKENEFPRATEARKTFQN